MQQAASLQNPVFDVGALLAAPCICNLEILKIALRAKILVFLIGQKSPSGVHYLRCVYTKEHQEKGVLVLFCVTREFFTASECVLPTRDS